MARNGKKSPAKKKSAGNNASPAARPLAATVKADATTIVLGANPALGATVKSPGLAEYGRVGMRHRLGSGFSHVAQRIMPKRVQPIPLHGGFAYDRKANRKIKKIARQMAKQAPQVKRRRSRLPLLVGLVLGMLGFGAYYTYTAIPWGSMADKVAEITDVRDWLAKTSGQKKPAGKEQITRSTPKEQITKRVVKRRVVKRRVVSKSSSPEVVQKAPQKTVRRVVNMTPTQKKIYIQKKRAAEQKRKWKSGVAKLENSKSKSAYRKASHERRSR